MSQNGLYTIEHFEAADGKIVAMLLLNASHPVFEGHFPGQPVLPGACMLDMIGDVLSSTLNCQLRLLKADNLKFITPVDPRQNDKLHLNITYLQTDNQFKIKATITAGSPCMKMDGVFEIA